MASPAVTTTTRGAVQGARSAVRETGRIARESLFTPRSSADSGQARLVQKEAEGSVHDVNRAAPLSSGIAARPVSPRPGQSALQQRQQGAGRTALEKNQIARQQNGIPINRVKFAGNSANNTSTQKTSVAAISSTGEELQSQGTSYFALLVSLATYSLLTSGGILFLLWTNFITWNISSIAKKLLPKPMHWLPLLIFTFVYCMELIFLVYLLILIISFVQDIINAFPPPLNTFFKF